MQMTTSSSTRFRHRTEENTGAANIELTAEDLRQIEQAASAITIQGDRYPTHLQKRVGR